MRSFRGIFRSAMRWGIVAFILAIAANVFPASVGVLAQSNLISNPSFESNSGIPTGYSQVYLAVPWTQSTNGTPDYFHALAPVSSGMSVPGNDFGNQNPHGTGQAYVGFNALPVNFYREYVETPLSSPLVAGQPYRVSFYVSLADRCRWAVDKIGAYLSIGPVGPVNIAYNLPFIPQINNPSGSYITDKVGWTLITGIYVATGGEDHIVIGNFFDNPSTTALMGQGGSYDFSYYYLDDVSVVLATNDLGDAPDSTNHAGLTMNTGYVANNQANFPTVYDPVLSGPVGPVHLDPMGLAYLGPAVSLEAEADIDTDQDILNNISPPNNSNQDGKDDGLISVPLLNCGSTHLTFSATNVLSTQVRVYINVWFDWTRDGDWDDIPRCAVDPVTDAIAPEWSVQNYIATLSPGFNNNLSTPSFRSIAPPPGERIWMRITLTDIPIDSANNGGPFSNPVDLGKGGSGPIGGYQYGETEDYLLGLATVVVGGQVEFFPLPGVVGWGALTLGLVLIGVFSVLLYRKTLS